jgi:hypothetical protein
LVFAYILSQDGENCCRFPVLKKGEKLPRVALFITRRRPLPHLAAICDIFSV